MLCLRNLLAAALITSVLPSAAFSLTPQLTESSDPYFALGSIETKQPTNSTNLFTGGSNTKPSALSALDRFDTDKPQKRTAVSTADGSTSKPGRAEPDLKSFESSFDFVAPTVPSNKTAASGSASRNDFRPPSVAEQNAQLSNLKPAAEKQTKPNFSFKPPNVTKSSEFSTDFVAPPAPGKPAADVQVTVSPPANSQPDNTLVSTVQKQEPDVEEYSPEQVVAVVGGEPIFVADMIFEANQLIEQRAGNAPDDIKKQLRGTVIKRLIPKFIDSKMLWIDAINGLPPEADVEAVIESASAEFDNKALPEILSKGNLSSAHEFDMKLRTQGSSLRRFRNDWAKEQLMRFFVSQKLKVDTDIRHEELLDYYHANLDSYKNKARVRWEELAVRYSKTPDRAEARRLITELGNEVVYGAPFEAVAKRASQGFTASEGGQHDWIGKGALVYTEVEEALFTIPVGQLSEIIESRDGLHIVRVVEREEDTITSFSEAQAGIEEKIVEKKRSGKFQEHLTMLRKRVPFEVLLPDVELPPYLAEQTQSAGWK